MNGTVIGTLIGGVLLFLSSLLVPVVSKRLNKAADAAAAAKTLSESAVALASGFQDRIEETEQRCKECTTELKVCTTELGKMKRRASKRDISLDAIHAALLEIVPLLPADSQATAPLRACIASVRHARYDEDE